MERVHNLVFSWISVQLFWVSFHLIWHWLQIFCIMTLICLVVSLVSLISQGILLLRVVGFFSNFKKAFKEIILFFQFIYMVDKIDWVLYVEPFLHPRHEASLIMLNDTLMCFWTVFARILLAIFESMTMQKIVQNFSFIIEYFCGLVPQQLQHQKMNLAMFVCFDFMKLLEE